MTEESLQKDLQDAIRARDQRRADILRGVITAAKNLKVEKRVDSLPETDLVSIIRKEAKKRTDIIDFATKGGRDEIAAEAKQEQAILEAYLPSQLSAEELAEVVDKLAAELGTKEIGPLMGALKQRYSGRFDGKQASSLIRALS